MPKKKLPTTLKLTFQEKGYYQLTDKGKPVQPVRFLEAVQFFVERFFSESLPQRLEKLSGLLEKNGKADLAHSFRKIKAKIEEFENPPFATGLMESDGFLSSQPIDRSIESRFLHAITAMLEQFMVESLLGRAGEVVDHSRFMRQIAGICDNPKTIRKTIEQVRYCVRDKALSDSLVEASCNRGQQPKQTRESRSFAPRPYNVVVSHFTSLPQMLSREVHTRRASSMFNGSSCRTRIRTDSYSYI